MSRLIALLAFSVLPFVSTACDKVPLLAPSGSIVTLSVNTTSLPMNGTAQITAMVLEDGGNAPQNGTVVTFSTTLGSMDPMEARTENGRATTTFHTGTRSGTAMVRAQSGDAEAEEVEIVIGAGGGTIALRIDSVANNGTLTVIVATVLDEAGNRVPRAPVTFTATTGQISPGFVTADANGEARATLTTSAASTVTATSGAAEGTIEIQAPGSIELEVTSTPPFEVDVPVSFTVTPSSEAFFGDVIVDFGDGTAPQNLGTVSAARAFSHTFNQAGNFTVTARATGADGVPTESSVTVNVTERAPIIIGVAATPNPVSLTVNGGTVTLTATPTLPTGSSLASISWTFGDGASGTGGQTTSHQYAATGTFTVTVTMTTTDGRDGVGQTSVTVTP